MDLIQKKILTTFIFLFAAAVIFPQEIKQSIAEAINKTFEENVTIVYDKYTVPQKLKNQIETKVKQKFYNESLYIIKIKNSNNLKAVALLDNVLGKELPITFLVIFNRDGSILKTEIVKYREPYGGAVQTENWTSQFTGKDINSGFKVGQDIDGISGATISVKSVTKGVKKLTLLYKEIKDSIWK